MSCQVCCETTSTKIACPCGFTCCRTCIRTYLCGQVSDPHCMSCKLAWGMDFVMSAIGKTYTATDYKKSREVVYAEFEKSQLPHTQDLARAFEKNEAIDRKIQDLIQEKKSFFTYGCTTCHGANFKTMWCKGCSTNDTYRRNVRLLPRYRNEMTFTYEETRERFLMKCLKCKGTNLNENMTCTDCHENYCKDCMRVLTECLADEKCHVELCMCVEYTCDICKGSQYDELIRQYRIEKSVTAPIQKKEFIMHCQVELCPGFLSTQYKCGLCSVYTCSTCFQVKEQDHVCKPDNVATAKLLREETKPCPSCTTRIYKIDGCDQMWCTECKTAFSWKTGQVVNGRIHNPHYYEHLRNTQGFVPREENPCGLPGIGEIRHTIRQFSAQKPRPLVALIENSIYQYYRFLEEIDTRLEGRNPHEAYLVDNRIKYLLKRVDEVKFRRKAFMYAQRSTQFKRHRELMEMLKEVLLSIFHRMYAILKVKESSLVEKWHPIQQLFVEIVNACIYYNDQHAKNMFTTIREDHEVVGMELHTCHLYITKEPTAFADFNTVSWMGTQEKFVYLRFQTIR